ncbi:hypothetical protein OIO90_003670 [Microbotryomycetes sp. JL221]|nr:hypothetical protein OIO90_003670 [Microbotryomycetes sp. JL221]
MSAESKASIRLREAELSDMAVTAALNDPALYAKGFESSRVFALISLLLASPSAPTKHLVKVMRSCYKFNVKGEDGSEVSWYADMKKRGKVAKLDKGAKPPVKPDVTIWVQDRDLVGLATGKLNPQKAFAAKRIKVRGNLDKALQVERILSQERAKLEGLVSQSADTPETGSKRERGGRWTSMGQKIKSKL